MTTQDAMRLVALMCFAQVCSMLGTFAMPALVPYFANHWHLSNTEAGWLNGVYFAGYALIVPLLGSLADRIDGRRIYQIAGTLIGLSWAGFALFADDFWSALVFRALAGIGLAGTFLPGLKAMLDRLPERSQSRAIAFYTASFSLGTSSSFFLTGWLSTAFGWRMVFWTGAASAALAIGLTTTALGPARQRSAPPDIRILNFRPVLRNRISFGYILGYTAHMWELFAYRSWIVAFLSFAAAGSISGTHWLAPTSVAALTGLVAMGASIAGEEMAQRYGRIRILSVVMWGSATYAVLVGLCAALPYPLLVGLCIVYALFVQADSAALHAGSVLNAEPARKGATMAIQSLLGFGAAFVAPLAIGLVLDASGGGHSASSWTAAFITMGAVVALGPVAIRRLCRPSATPVPPAIASDE